MPSTKKAVPGSAGRAGMFFSRPEKFRAWLATHHEKKTELWVGFYKRESGQPSITWPESVDEALCFGWIDGLRQSIDALSYRIRFTRRKPASNWSAINIERVGVLTKEGRMSAAGRKAFEARKDARSKVYSHENKDVELSAEYEKQLRKNKPASKYFAEQAPSYRKAARRWVMGAKQEKTRDTRMTALIEYSARREFIPPFRWSMQAPNRPAKAKPAKAKPAKTKQ
jgi:uncharacterized protein YdeI (YjbR/CyaY-like superfamily)